MARTATLKKRAKSAKKLSRTPFFSLILIALKDAAVKAHSDNCIGLAKEAAYSFILSFFPMLLALIAFFFAIGVPSKSVQEVLRTLHDLLPGDSFKIVASYIERERINLKPHTSILWLSLAGGLWTGSGMICSIQNAFDKIYDVTPRWNFWVKRIVAILLVIGLGVPMTVSTVATIFAEQVEVYLAVEYGLDIPSRLAWTVGRWVMVLITTIVIVALLYRVGVK